MPISLECPCGKQLKLRDDLAGLRIKCPACGDALDVPEDVDPSAMIGASTAEAPAESTEKPVRPNHHASQNRLQIEGGRVSLFGSTVVPHWGGKTTLSLTEEHLVRNTNQDQQVILLRHVSSVEIKTVRNPIWLILGLLTLAAVVGVLILLVYAFKKSRVLIVRTASTGAAIRVSGEEPQEFIEQILARIP